MTRISADGDGAPVGATAIEAIHWIAVEDAMPELNKRVLVYACEAAEPVWIGYFGGEYWYGVGHVMYGNAVTAWATMPTGPQR